MNEEYYAQHIDTEFKPYEGFWSEDYVWATSEESKRDALSLHLIGSIVHKHGGTVRINAEGDSLNIDVPDEKKMACAEELSRKVDMTLQ